MLFSDETGREAKRVARIYCQTNDGTIYEVHEFHQMHGANLEARIQLYVNGEVVPPNPLGGSSLTKTEVNILPPDSVKALKELLESNPNDFLEMLIDQSTFKFTELGAKIIRNIEPNEDHVNRLYKSIKVIEKRAEWFDVSKLLGYSEVDGDPATLVTSVIKDSIKGSFGKGGLLSWASGFSFDKEPPEDLVTLVETIFEGYYNFQRCDDFQTRNQIIKFISFFVELAELLSCQR